MLNVVRRGKTVEMWLDSCLTWTVPFLSCRWAGLDSLLLSITVLLFHLQTSTQFTCKKTSKLSDMWTSGKNVARSVNLTATADQALAPAAAVHLLSFKTLIPCNSNVQFLILDSFKCLLWDFMLISLERMEKRQRASPWTHLDHRLAACVKPCDETYWKCLITVLGKKLSYKMIP